LQREQRPHDLGLAALKPNHAYRQFVKVWDLVRSDFTVIGS
jgi:hypothetical protein